MRSPFLKTPSWPYFLWLRGLFKMFHAHATLVVINLECHLSWLRGVTQESSTPSDSSSRVISHWSSLFQLHLNLPCSVTQHMLFSSLGIYFLFLSAWQLLLVLQVLPQLSSLGRFLSTLRSLPRPLGSTTFIMCSIKWLEYVAALPTRIWVPWEQGLLFIYLFFHVWLSRIEGEVQGLHVEWINESPNYLQKLFPGLSNWVSLFCQEVVRTGQMDLILNEFLLGEGNGTPLQYSCLENPMGGGAW